LRRCSRGDPCPAEWPPPSLQLLVIEKALQAITITITITITKSEQGKI